MQKINFAHKSYRKCHGARAYPCGPIHMGLEYVAMKFLNKIFQAEVIAIIHIQDLGLGLFRISSDYKNLCIPFVFRTGAVAQRFILCAS